ncbi:MAG: tetratricopeptide repeat protein [Hyphomonadaceae bacterium]
MTDDEALSASERALAQGDLTGAEQALQARWPNMAGASADGLHGFAMVRHAGGLLPEAAELLRMAINVSPGALRHHIALGHVLMAANDYGAAADAYAQAYRIDAKWPGLLLVYSRANYLSGRLDEAEKAARHLLKETPSAEAWDALSNALRGQGKGEEALAAADSALKLDPHSTEALHSRGGALLALKRGQEAHDVFEQLVERGVSAPVLWVNRAAALQLMGRNADANAIFDDAGRRWPNMPNLQGQIAARRK